MKKNYVLFKLDTLKELMKELDAFFFICGVKNLDWEDNGEIFALYNTNHFVLFTETSVEIEFRRKDNKFEFIVNFHEVMLNVAKSFKVLPNYLRYPNRYDNPTRVQIYLSFEIDGNGDYYMYFGEHSWTSDNGMFLYRNDILKNAIWGIRSDGNYSDVIEMIKTEYPNEIKELLSKPIEYWETIKKGNNSFQPNIINDLKFGGAY